MKIRNVPISLAIIAFGCNTNKNVECNIEENITYTSHIATIIETNCFECHAPDVYKKKASRNKIFDYKNLKEMAESNLLYGSINHEKGFIAMPYKKRKKIDSCDILTIKTWIESGMKE
jgi:hypothetical protein